MNLVSIDESERISARLYSEYLCKMGLDHSYTKGEKNRPPDFTFKYARSKVAVEVTRLPHFLEDSEGDIEVIVPLNTIDKICSDAKKLLGNKLKKNIYVYVTPPLNKKQQLLNEIVSFAEKDYSGKINLLCRKNCYIISKEGTPDINMFLLWPRSEKRSKTKLNSPIILDKITYSIENRLNAKLPILKKLSDFDERILIIYNEHIFGDLNNVQRAIDKFLPLPTFINGMFLVYKKDIFELSIDN
jgi:hypothetical protein